MHYNKETKQYEVNKATEEEMAKKILLFMNTAKDVIKETDKQYKFVCPLCGGEAVGGKVSINNHIHAQCNKCNFSIMQ